MPSFQTDRNDPCFEFKNSGGDSSRLGHLTRNCAGGSEVLAMPGAKPGAGETQALLPQGIMNLPFNVSRKLGLERKGKRNSPALGLNSDLELRPAALQGRQEAPVLTERHLAPALSVCICSWEGGMRSAS